MSAVNPIILSLTQTSALREETSAYSMISVLSAFIFRSGEHLVIMGVVNVGEAIFGYYPD